MGNKKAALIYHREPLLVIKKQGDKSMIASNQYQANL